MLVFVDVFVVVAVAGFSQTFNIFRFRFFAKVSACELFAFVTIYSLFVVISNVKRLLSTYFTTILGAANKNNKQWGEFKSVNT